MKTSDTWCDSMYYLTRCRTRPNARDVRQGTSCWSASESISCCTSTAQ